MRNKLVLLVSLMVVVGLGIRVSARIGKSQPRPVSIASPENIFQLSPRRETPLVKEGERVVELTSVPPPEDTVNFDGPYDNNAVGLTAGGTYKGAMRMTPTELGTYSGWEVIAVIWYHHETGTHGDMVEIFDQGTPSVPGAVITTQSITATGTGWFREDLLNPVPISGTSDIWCSIQVTHAAGEFPVGVDAGPAVVGKGDFVYFSGTWDELGNLGLPLNWNIRAIVDSGGAGTNLDVRPLSIDSPGGMVDPSTLLQPGATVRNQGLLSATFNVFCNIDTALGGNVYSDMFSIVGMPSSTDSSFTFALPWTPGGTGAVYDVTVYTVLPGDQNTGNDTIMSVTVAFDTSITPIVSPFTMSPPTIDGFLSPGEWSDATMLDVSDVLGGPDMPDPPGSAILYVKNDSNNVYFACDGFADASATDFDQIGLYFDDNHDGAFPGAPDTTEGNLWYQEFAAGDRVDWRWIQSGPVFAPGPPYPNAGFPLASTATIGHMQFEAVLPMGTLPEELNATPGSTVGFFLLVLGAPSTIYGWWPYNVGGGAWFDPAGYGDLILSAGVGVEEEITLPSGKAFTLMQTRPNPINSTAEILYQLSDRGKVSLNIYDITGSLVRTLVNGTEDAGEHRVVWDGRDARGLDVSSGLYFYRLAAGNATATRKLVLLR